MSTYIFNDTPASGYYLAKDMKTEEPFGIVWVDDYRHHGSGTIVGLQLVGHANVYWDGPYTKDEAETFDAFELFPKLKQLRTATTEISTMGSGNINGFQLTFVVPGEESMDGPEFTTVTIPGGLIAQARKAAKLGK